MENKRRGLGRNLSSIFEENFSGNEKPMTLKISQIEPNKSQPRKVFDEEKLAELSDSIARHGLLQPLLVRPFGRDLYQLVAGERRWRASRQAGLSEVPVLVRELSDLEVMETSLIENLQRDDLSPLEEAEGYRALMHEYDFTQEDVAGSVGRSRSHVANALRLLDLPEKVREFLAQKRLTAGHARAILSLKTLEDMGKVAELAINRELSVREVEKICKDLLEKAKKKPTRKPKRQPIYDEVEVSLKEHLGRKVKVLEKTRGKRGTVQIEFFDEDDLMGLAELFARS